MRLLFLLVLLLVVLPINAISSEAGSIASVNVRVIVTKPLSDCIADFDCVDRLCEITDCFKRSDGYYYMKWIW